MGAASPTAFALKTLTELRPLGLESSELGGLFGGGGGGGRGVTKVYSHIWSPHDAVSRRSVRCWSCRRAVRSQSDLRHDFGHSLLGRSSSNDTVSICNYNVLKLIHEDSSKVVVEEHAVKHVQPR